ncbi:BOI-related E3 ubiquitin-protein ligase 1-like [Nicotiana tomentosiformis]|uniref:BOI-related E3 ubiquitin-protein ligase 1-like n=1 Tax=Nicotiana tomentosiformis TaxID=4098 RepID=UPI00051C0AF9|nr:probable BOI-related E3 ubiquitin-protein ligase 2 [Nicotiana tomentosiformis]
MLLQNPITLACPKPRNISQSYRHRFCQQTRLQYRETLPLFIEQIKLLFCCGEKLVDMAIQAELYSENLGFPLGVSQDLMDNNACGFNEFSFNPQQQQYYEYPQQHQQLQNLYEKDHQNLKQFVPKQNITSQSLTSQLEKQNIEINRFISLQKERLRLIIEEQRKKQMALILRKYESKAQYLLKQKDEEIAKAANRTRELQDFLKRMEIEKQTWQRMAKEKEAMVMSLNITMEQLRESACSSTNNRGTAEDAESCCHVADEQEYGHQKMMCKSCKSRKSCMIFLPCRHLCSCKYCNTFLHSCPACNMLKKASIEAFI